MIFLKKFANHEEYEAYYEAELENKNALRPNISACARIPRECDRVHYNPKIQV